jgi:type I restriction enzyme S subunit
MTLQIKAKYKPYPKYKPSGVEWIGEIPEEWEKRRVKLLFKIVNGSTPESKYDKYWNGNIVWITPDDMGDLLLRDIYDSSRKITEEGYHSCGTTLTKPGSIILSTRAPIGHTGLTTVFTCTNQGCKTLEPKYLLNSIYYFYLVVSTKEELISLGNGSTYLELSKNKLSNVALTLPPLREQILIAEFLDRETTRIDGIIAKQTQMIELLKEKRSALITQAVTKGLDPKVKMKPSGVEWIGDIPKDWEVTNLKRVLEQKITDGPHETPELIPEGIPFISAESIKNNKIDFDLRRGNISIQLHNEYCKKAKPKLHDIFFIKSGATTGNVAYVETTEEFSIWSPLALIRCGENILFYKYLFYLMLSEEFRTQVELAWSYGTQQNIGMGVIGRLLIIRPTFTEQQAIATFLDKETEKIDTLINKIEKQIELLNEYKQSLITQAVTGRLMFEVKLHEPA